MEVNKDGNDCGLPTGAWSNGCCLLPSTQTPQCGGEEWWEHFGIAVSSIVSDKEGIGPLLAGDRSFGTQRTNSLIPFPCSHLQDTTSGCSGPKSTFFPSCYCPWLVLRSFQRKKWTVSDLGGCLGFLRVEGRTQARGEGEVVWSPFRSL